MRSRSVLILLLLMTFGCASAGAWKYQPISKPFASEVVSDSRVAVLPFDDRRPEGNSNMSIIQLIPIVPFGPIDYNEIEGASGFLTHASYQVRPPEDLAKALVSELEAANLFSESYYTERRQEPEVENFFAGLCGRVSLSGKGYQLRAFCLRVSSLASWFACRPYNKFA